MDFHEIDIAFSKRREHIKKVGIANIRSAPAESAEHVLDAVLFDIKNLDHLHKSTLRRALKLQRDVEKQLARFG